MGSVTGSSLHFLQLEQAEVASTRGDSRATACIIIIFRSARLILRVFEDPNLRLAVERLKRRMVGLV